MRVQRLTAVALLMIACGMASCSSLVIPKRGFLTRYFAGSSLQHSVQVSDDFVGRPLHPPINSYVGAAGVAIRSAAQGSTRISSSMAETIRTCAVAAHQRASDVAFQGFGETTQKSVYDNTYSDCVSWRTNH